jgi:hypothetical protein
VIANDDIAALLEHLAWPRGRDIPGVELPAWLERLARVAAQRGAGELGELAAAVVRDPDSPDRLYALGYALIDAGAPAMAASVLWHCLALVGDSEEVVCELVSALESALAYGDAFAILDAHPELRARSFLCRYLHAFDAAMIGSLSVTRAALAELVADSPDTEAMRATIEAIVARGDRVAGACPLDGADLRGWHYVLAGGLLLHQSPYGFAEPMRGRYAYLHDSNERVAFGLERLVALVRAAGEPVPCVYAPPGPDHEAVARVLATKLAVPLAPWPAVGTPAPGIVALYDLARIPAAEVPRLVPRRAGQILFAHASPWTRDSPIAPDVTTLLYQTLDPPDRLDQLASAAALPADDLATDEPDRYAALVAHAWPLSPGPRARLWAGGPVASNRF